MLFLGHSVLRFIYGVYNRFITKLTFPGVNVEVLFFK